MADALISLLECALTGVTTGIVILYMARKGLLPILILQEEDDKDSDTD